MNVVDSSAWLEYFAGSQNAENFAKVIENTDELIVPTLCLYEVFKRILQQRSEHEALQAVAAMQQAKVVDIDSRISIEAARLSVEYRLPLADSVILAATRQFQATLWTQDVHFEGMERVQYTKPMKSKQK